MELQNRKVEGESGSHKVQEQRVVQAFYRDGKDSNLQHNHILKRKCTSGWRLIGEEVVMHIYEEPINCVDCELNYMNYLRTIFQCSSHL